MNPTTASKWLLLGYAAGVTLFLLGNADAPDVVLLSLVFLPWIVGPAVIATVVVARSTSAIWLWAFLVLEGLIIASTLWAWHYLIVVAPDAQNGIAMMLLPVLQYVVVLGAIMIGALCTWLVGRGHAGEDRTS